MASIEELEATVRALESRLRAVEDVEAIQRLKARYGALTDERYGPDGPKPPDELARIAGEIAALFSEDAVWDAGGKLGVARGRDAIRERLAVPTLKFSWHFFVKPELQVDGDRASGTWDILAPCTLPDGRPFWMSGVEHDEYARIDGRWLHTRMKLRVVFFSPYDEGWARR